MKKLFLLLILIFSTNAMAGNELNLYDVNGNAVAYIALDDELTVYSWSGEPGAYLKRGRNNAFDVYGFNGKHLGWFIKGMLFDHDGYAVCALKESVVTSHLPSLKSLKKLKPLKSLPELPPLTPLLKDTFGHTDCSLLLSSGISKN